MVPPRGTTPEDSATSVFGLSAAQLRPIVEAAAGEPVASFDISIEHEVEGFYGFAAEKLIPTFSYVTPGGRRDRVTIFAKHSRNPESPEAGKYRFLGAHGVPIPEVYGVARSPECRPVLFIEYVDVSDKALSVRSIEGLLELLSLMARERDPTDPGGGRAPPVLAGGPDGGSEHPRSPLGGGRARRPGRGPTAVRRRPPG
jgi:hypothetical protein